jgi:hypothetical protein
MPRLARTHAYNQYNKDNTGLRMLAMLYVRESK